jgi:eukaryotic-like serine/threonine-protein kinase
VRFKVDAFAARGGMAEVFRAHDDRGGSCLAYKRLQRRHRWDPRVRRRFALEAAFLRSARVEGVPRFVAAGRSGGAPFIVMEWISGQTLAERLAAEGVRTVADAGRIVRDVLAVLARIHCLGWAHGDVTPANIVVDGSRVSLIDFGLVTRLDSDGRGEICGTPTYMAPEQRRGEPATVASDLYAVGRLLAEMLGESPPAPLASVAATALRAEPGERFRSAGAMADALAEALAACDGTLPIRRMRELGELPTLPLHGCEIGADGLAPTIFRGAPRPRVRALRLPTGG